MASYTIAQLSMLASSIRTRLATVVGLLVALGGTAEAQTVQVSPFGGYRFGGDLFESITATALDIDGAPSVGATVDVFGDYGLAVTFIYSHQQAHVSVPSLGLEPVRVRLSIDHWHAGGTQEVGHGRVRPFYVGSLGLTRFGSADNSEVRFSLGAGGGVKLMPSRHIGARLDGRLYAVFVDGETTSGFCTPGACFFGLDVSVAWQVAFNAGLIVSF
jgi:hypothetical protein